MSTTMKIAVVGTRVRCALHYAGPGVIFAIHGVQTPEQVSKVFGGMGVRGGTARFDVVHENGSVSRGISEAIVRGVQWQIYDEVAGAEEIQQLLDNAAETTAEKERHEAEAKAQFSAAVEHLKADPAYAHLEQGDDDWSGKLAAKNIRAALRKCFPVVKFSVRKTDYGSVSITWTDGPTAALVEQIANRHKAGSFNGMEDIYEYNRAPFVTVFGGAKYISASRTHSPALVERAIADIYAEYSGNLTGIERPTADTFGRGDLIHTEVPGLGESLHRIVHKRMHSIPL